MYTHMYIKDVYYRIFYCNKMIYLPRSANINRKGPFKFAFIPSNNNML